MSFNIASYIDHTILKPVATGKNIQQLCVEALQNNFAAVCVPPYYVTKAKQLLTDSEVKTATVIGFPFGYSNTASKLAEIHQAITDGADELDMVHNIAALKEGDWGFLQQEMKACIEPIHAAGKIIKVIVESGELTDQEIMRCCALYAPLGIDFMKTSTGYSATGATIHAVQLMRAHLPVNIAIKASGGIRNFAFAKELIDAGATRLGCSASVSIVEEARDL
ncbi:deoxyribose-phosphate aldolase [Chitinophagaceae bacterium MMS25-I14]